MAFKLTVLKWLLFVLNTVLPILGVLLLAFSVLELKSLPRGSLAYFTIIIQTFVGAFIVLTSFLGCYGTCRVSIGLLCSYGICLIILLAFHVYILIIAVNGSNYMRKVENFEAMWRNHTLHATEFITIQQDLKCCGGEGPQDYVLRGSAIPFSCYADFQRSAENLYSDGCLEKLEIKEANAERWGLIIKWALLFVEVMALAAASIMANTIHNNHRRAQF